MKQEQWTEQLREKLSGYQEAVPDGLWGDIEAALDEAPVKRRPVVAWRRWSAAAAIILLLAGGSLLLWNREETKMTETAEMADVLQTQTEAVQTEMSEAAKTSEPVAPLLAAATPKVQKQMKMAEPAVLEQEKPVLLIQDEQQPSQGQDLAQQNEEPLTQEETTVSAPAVEQKADKKEVLSQPTELFPSVEMKRATRQPLVAALYAGDGLGDRNDVDRVQMSHDMAQKYAALNGGGASRAAEPIWLADYEERENHERPFAIGMQLRYPLSERLSLSSGLVYTRLKSEFTKVMKGSEIVQQQQLHYVGMPLALQYRLWQIGHLSVYASAGAQADWNVSARMSVNGMQNDIDKDRLQWSLSGSMGLSYDVTPHIGLFLEPGIRHYIDNQSPVQNYFKDKPTNISLQMGVQWNIGN